MYVSMLMVCVFQGLGLLTQPFIHWDKGRLCSNPRVVAPVQGFRCIVPR